MADKEEVVLTSAVVTVASRKRRQGRRSCWVLQFGTFSKFQSSRVRPVRPQWRRSRIRRQRFSTPA